MGDVMRTAILIMSLALVSGDAAANWDKVSNRGFETTYVDTNTTQRMGEVVQMWDLGDFEKLQTLPNNKQYLSRKSNWEYDCGSTLARRREISWYSGRMGAGEVVHSEVGVFGWHQVASGTQMKSLWRIACGK